MREILPGILTWPWFSQRHGYDFNGYLIRHSAGNVAVDPVELDDSVLGGLAREGGARVVLTNRNHYRAAAKLRDRTGPRTAAHPSHAGFARKTGVPLADR